MVQPLYHWDFTSSENIADASGTSIFDKEANLEAKIILFIINYALYRIS